jgi:chromosome segregation ATPase
VTLIDVECALAAPIDFLRHCNTSFGLNPLPYSAVATACDRAGSDIQHLIAAQMVAQSRETQDLIAELEACSLPIGEPATPPAIDCQALYARQRDGEEERRIVEKECAAYRALAEQHLARLVALESTRDEATAKLQSVEGRFVEEVVARQSMVQQLRQAQEALEAAAIDRQARSDENENLQIKIDAQEEVRRELEQENELLRQRSRQAQESYEALVLERRHLSDGNEELLRAQDALRLDMQAMRLDREKKDREISGLLKARNEQSDKISRLEKDLEAQRKACHDLMQENDLIIAQLHNAQELLEVNYIQLEKTKYNLKDHGRMLRSTKARLECAERKLQFRERRIRYLEESRSWRITAPLRNAARLLFGKGKGESHS